MKDVSNNTIVLLLIFALVLTVVSTIVSIGKLGNLLGGFDTITGAVKANTSTGTSTLTISQFTSITNDHSAIQFGSGYVNYTCAFCNMTSNGTISPGCCAGFNKTNNRGFLIENTGNINISVNYSCAGKCTAATFVNGTGPSFKLKPEPNSIARQTGEKSTTDSLPACQSLTGIRGLNFTVYKDVTAAGQWLCGNNTRFPLSFKADLDAFVVDLNVTIPENAYGGAARTATFTFKALTTG